MQKGHNPEIGKEAKNYLQEEKAEIEKNSTKIIQLPGTKPLNHSKLFYLFRSIFLDD